MSTDAPEQESWVGQSVVREEDKRLITGHGDFVDDEKRVNMGYLALVRSPYAHATIENIDTSRAEDHPDVECVITGDEIEENMNPYIQIGPEPGGNLADYPMAINKVRYQGEPVVALVTNSRLAIEDVADLVDVDYDVLDPVIDSEEALEDHSIVHEDTVGTNEAYHDEFEWGDVDEAFEEAAHVVEIDKLYMHRFTAAPLENNGCVAEWEPYGDIHYRTNNNFPSIAMTMIGAGLGVGTDKIHCETKDSGGSFGVKINNYPYMALAAYASKKCGGQPVKWIETRSEHLQASGQSNERTFRNTRVALDEDGVITAVDTRAIDDAGAYLRYEPLGAIIWAQVTPATYRFQNLRVDFSQITTNKCPTSPVRGYSRLQHLWFLERVIDICGHELGIDPDTIRERNYIKAEEFPWETPNKCIYDSGDFHSMLDKAKDQIGWDEWKQKQQEAREEGRWLGIGIGTTLDSGTNNFSQSKIVNPHNPFSGNSEAANVHLELDGSIVVSSGATPTGQGHETTASQQVADELNLHPDMIEVRTGFDSDRNTHTGHSGSYASQFAVSGLSAVHGATQKLKDELIRLGAFALQEAETDLELGVGDQGPCVQTKDGDNSIPFWQLANMVNSNNADIPEHLDDVSLNCRHVYKPDFGEVDLEEQTGNLTLTYASQLHIAVIEIDQETYNPQILDYVCIDDCGNVINPMIVEGQVHGGTAHGIGGSLMERCKYDETGNLVTSTFSDFAPITAMNMPDLKFEHQESPSPFSFNGAKGMGEGGGTPFHTISAALQDALVEEDIAITESFYSSSELHELVNEDVSSWDDVVNVTRQPS